MNKKNNSTNNIGDETNAEKSLVETQTRKFYDLICEGCGHINNEKKTTSFCVKCGEVLSVKYYGKLPYMQLPLKSYTPDNIRIYDSPLVKHKKVSDILGVDIYFKLESHLPSGSFKDRGSYTEVLKAKELNKKGICLASTGNMAASASMYAKAYNLDCVVFIPDSTNPSKVAQAKLAGARIITQPLDYSGCELKARQYAAKNDYYLGGDFVFRQEGQKSCAYELSKQIDLSSIDYLLIPCGCGTNLSAIGKGFYEMVESSVLSMNDVPKLIAVQASGSSAIVDSINKGKKSIKKSVNTMAQATAVCNPLDYIKVKRYLDWSHGFGINVTEDDLYDAYIKQYRDTGIFAEPAGVLPYAAVLSRMDLFEGKKVILLISGHGLKDTEAANNFDADLTKSKTAA